MSKEISDLIIDVEALAKDGKPPPKGCRGYRIPINGNPYEFSNHCITGRDILGKVGVASPEEYTIRIYLPGGGNEKIELDDEIDITVTIIEKIKYVPAAPQEG